MGLHSLGVALYIHLDLTCAYECECRKFAYSVFALLRITVSLDSIPECIKRLSRISCKMSLTSTDPQRIAYRRLLSSFANALDSENIQKIVYIYSGDSNIDSSEKGCAFHLLLKIERLNYFSFENPSPLVQIAEDAGRLDWAEKFKEYVETRATAPPPKSITKKRSSPIPSEERRYLEDVHDVLVSKVVDLEEQFQEMWKKEVVTKEEGMKLLRKSEKIIINDIQGELRKGMKKLQTRPNSGYSSSGSSSGSELSTSPTYTMPTTKCM